MTNFDVITETLSRVTGKPAIKYRQLVSAAVRTGAMPKGRLFDECPDGKERVDYFVQHEAEGILNWAIQGGIMANRCKHEQPRRKVVQRG